MVSVASANQPPAFDDGVMGCRVRDVRALALAVCEAAPEVVIDQAEDLRRRLLEQELMLRYEADLSGVPVNRVEAALASTRAAAHVLEAISAALSIEMERQDWIATQVVRFATRLIETAAAQLVTVDPMAAWALH